MDRAFALHVLGWWITSDGDSAISPTGGRHANDEKHKDGWLEYYSTSLEAIAPAIFETERFVSAKLQSRYFAQVKSRLVTIPNFSSGTSGLILAGDLVQAEGVSFDTTASAALCKAALMCKLDELEKAAAWEKRRL